jgi:hypothetical protein
VSDQVAVVNDHLKFNDLSYYEKVVEDQDLNLKEQLNEQISGTQNFISLRRFYEDKNARQQYLSKSGRQYAKENPVEDDFLASILNPDGVVQIGEWIFKVNLEKEVVLALNQKHAALYQDLVEENIDREQIYVYNTHDDVLTLIKEGIYGTVNKNAKMDWWWCDNYAVRKKDHYDDDVYTTTYNPSSGTTKTRIYRAHAKHVYQKAGIYFSLVTKLKYMKFDEGQLFWDQSYTNIFLQYSYSWKKRCGSSSDSGSAYVGVSNERKLVRRHYSSVNALTSYSLYSYYEYESIPHNGNERTILLRSLNVD